LRSPADLTGDRVFLMVQGALLAAGDVAAVAGRVKAFLGADAVSAGVQDAGLMAAQLALAAFDRYAVVQVVQARIDLGPAGMVLLKEATRARLRAIAEILAKVFMTVSPCSAGPLCCFSAAGDGEEIQPPS
jgi:hypothetical protein